MMRPDTIKQRIQNHIDRDPKKRVYTLTDFYLDGGNYESVKKTVSRLVSEGKLLRVNKGVYESPYYSRFLERQVDASPLDVAKKIAEKNHWTIVPSGNTALNALGLSTQVPMEYHFVSNGINKEFKLGKISIYFKHVPLREIDGMSSKNALIIEAVKAIGKAGMNDSIRAQITSLLSDSEKKRILRESMTSRVWIFEEVRRILAVTCTK
jgi:hypothetical protein